MKTLSSVGLALSISVLGCAGVQNRPADDGSGGSGVGGSGVGGSGSGAGGRQPGGSGGTGVRITPDGGKVCNALSFDVDCVSECGHKEFNLVRKPPDLFLVLDRSGSLINLDGLPLNRWERLRPAIDEVVMRTATAINWGAKFFPEGIQESCIAASVTNKIDVAIAPNNYAAMSAAMTATTPQGNGTPTAEAMDQALIYLRSLPANDAPRYILLATDGEPNCGTDPRGRAVQSITNAAMAGFHTFVVGVSITSTNTVAELNAMAVAGLEPRPVTNPLDLKFYLADTKDQLVMAMDMITGKIASCHFPLDTRPPDPGNIAVKVAGQKAPRDPAHTNGWDYTDSTSMAVDVYGTWCDQIKNQAANIVEFIYGCPNEIIP